MLVQLIDQVTGRIHGPLCLLQINRMDYVEINIDHKFHRHLIGKSGANSE